MNPIALLIYPLKIYIHWTQQTSQKLTKIIPILIIDQYTTHPNLYKILLKISVKLNRNGRRSCISRFSSQNNYRLRSKWRCKRFSWWSREKIAFSLGTRPAGPGNDQNAYDNRQRAFLGSILKSPAAQWYQGLALRFILERYKRPVHW